MKWVTKRNMDAYSFALAGAFRHASGAQVLVNKNRDDIAVVYKWRRKDKHWLLKFNSSWPSWAKEPKMRFRLREDAKRFAEVTIKMENALEKE